MKRIKTDGDIGDISKAFEDYAPNADIDDDDIYRIKKLLRDCKAITRQDRALFLLYAEVGSLQNLARLVCPIFRVSKSTIRNEIARIRRIILQSL